MPAIVSGVFAAAILLVNVNFPYVVELVISVAILWANLAYLMVTATLLERRLRGWPGRGETGAGFSLGRWGLLVNVLAVAWGVFIVVNIAWPRPSPEDIAWYQPYAALLVTGAMLAVGGVYYGLVQRHKTGVLAEHQARAPATR